MYIYNETLGSINNISLYLSIEEAKELKEGLNNLIKKPRNNHIHINSEDFQKELTVCIYREEDKDTFDEISKKLIWG